MGVKYKIVCINFWSDKKINLSFRFLFAIKIRSCELLQSDIKSVVNFDVFSNLNMKKKSDRVLWA